MGFETFFHSTSGKVIISIILGLGLAAVFRQTCEGRECVVLRGPKMEEIEDKYIKYGNKCYKFKPKSVESCSLDSIRAF